MNAKLKKRMQETLRIWESACEETKTIKVLDFKQFGEVLRFHRKDAGISLPRMAKQMGVSEGFLSNCEAGRMEMTPARRWKYVEALATINREGE